MTDDFMKLPEGVGSQLENLQKKLLEAQEELAKATVSGTAGGGAVKITLTGDQRCTEVAISPEALAETDGELLQEMVKAALNQALENSRMMAAEHLSPLSPNLKP
ncbi:MAG: YbaB/EbfC family nucleoid-associated protein [Anaerolineae bacterium]|nr:YbaB/EbfC family nucleoid-associated protein [Anaerolineae bacterium]